MRLYAELQYEEEKISNFKLAEAVFDFCQIEGWGLDAEAIAKMLLAQACAPQTEGKK